MCLMVAWPRKLFFHQHPLSHWFRATSRAMNSAHWLALSTNLASFRRLEQNPWAEDCRCLRWRWALGTRERHQQHQKQRVKPGLAASSGSTFQPKKKLTFLEWPRLGSSSWHKPQNVQEHISICHLDKGPKTYQEQSFQIFLFVSGSFLLGVPWNPWDSKAKKIITWVLFLLLAATWRRQWHPTPVLLPGKSHGRRTLVGCSPWSCCKLDTTEWLHFHFSLSCIGGGNGNPLQCSCLENPRDGEAWWADVYGVAQSQTQLKWFSSSSHYFEHLQRSRNCALSIHCLISC